MRAIRVIGLLILALGLTLFTRNNAHAIGRRAHPLLAAFQMQAAPGSQLTVLAPKPGQKVPGDTVTIQFQLQRNATVQSVPTFQLRLDANDVIQTADTSYTFSGLQPGAHTVRIQCVDANGIPVPNAASQIQFTVVQQTAAVSEEDSAEARGEGCLWLDNAPFRTGDQLASQLVQHTHADACFDALTRDVSDAGTVARKVEVDIPLPFRPFPPRRRL